MILITGGTGFIGQVLFRQLTEAGHPVRLLLPPASSTGSGRFFRPLSSLGRASRARKSSAKDEFSSARGLARLPKGIPMDVSVASLSDPRALRAAFSGVTAVYHLMGGEFSGVRANLLKSDIQPTQAIVNAAADAGVDRFFTLSHLGADRASAFPVLKAKGVVEETVRRSGIDYTILRSSLVFGPNDHFTTNIAKTLHALPGVFLVPGTGSMLLQPLWVEDLATCLVWALEDDTTRNQVFEVGGPEYLSLRQVTEVIMSKTRTRRRIVGVSPATMRLLTMTVDSAFPHFPVTVFWLDYLALNRTAPLDTIPRFFKLMPARFVQRVNYLTGVNWGRELRRTLFRRR